MGKRESIDNFFKSGSYAVVGVSRNKNKFGSVIYREMKKAGEKVFPVNPRMESFEEDRCYADLASLEEKPGGVIVSVKPEMARDVAEQAWSAGLTNIWFQQGSQSDDASAFCREKGMNCVTGECVFMYHEPVQSIHKFHRGVAKLFGKYHRQ